MSAKRNLIFDVGLHKGEDTAFYLKKDFDVVAFEADPGLAAHCRSRFRDELAQGRLHIVEGAVAPTSAGSRIAFYQNQGSSIWGTSSKTWSARNETLGAPSRLIDVNRVDISDAFRTYGIPFYLKIDIEGTDRFVLETLREFPDRPQHVSIESEKVDFNELEAELRLLSELGYTKFRAVQQANLPGQRIITKTLSGDAIEHTFEECCSGPFAEDVMQPWRTYREIKSDYRRIFLHYRLLGDNGILRKIRGGHRIINAPQAFYGRLLPGWYDTHASL